MNVPVPAAARSLSTRFRFFQFGYFSTVGTSAWAIDDLYISGFTVGNGTDFIEE